MKYTLHHDFDFALAECASKADTKIKNYKKYSKNTEWCCSSLVYIYPTGLRTAP